MPLVPLKSLKNGDAEAAQKLWSRNFEALVRLARDRLRGAPRALADEEDAALAAFDSFVRGAARGRYPRLDDRDDLWRLLVVITERKALDQAQHERRQKRGGGKIIGTAGRPDVDRKDRSIARAVSQEPTPEFAASVADECRRLLGSFRDDSLRAVAVLRMEGCTNEEVVRRVGCSLRTHVPYPGVSPHVAESNLLFGLIALQNGLIDQDQLVNAFRAWTRDKTRALAEHLVACRDLDASDRAAVEALAARHLKKHGGDADKSLAAIAAGRSTIESLAGIGEPHI